jgi:hypothetical protein
MQTLCCAWDSLHLRVSAKETRSSQPVRIVLPSIRSFLTFLSSYLRRLQEAAAAAAAAQQDSINAIDPIISPISGKNNPSSPIHSSMSSPNPQNNPPNYLDSSLSSVPSLSTGVIPPSRYPIAADTFQSSYQNMYSVSPNVSSLSRSPKIDHSSFSSPVDQFSTYPLHNWSYRQHQTLSVPAPSVIPPLSYYYRPHRLEDVAPRETILLILALFFDFVYPLTPCLHKPSFMTDIHARREERDPLFFALIMSTVASTLIQVPRSYLPMERYTVRKLAQTCHEASRHITVASYDPPTSTHVVIRYL